MMQSKANQETWAFAETISDCKELERWVLSNQRGIARVITLSLEADQYLKQRSALPHTHIWNLLSMEELLDKAYSDSEKEAKALVSRFSTRNDAWYDVAALHELHLEFLVHATAATAVAKELLALIREKKVYVVIPAQSQVFPLSIHAPKAQLNRSYNGIFKSIFATLLSRERIKFCFTRSGARKQIDRMNGSIHWEIIKRTVWDLVEFCYGKLFKKSRTKQLADSGEREMLFSGWGRDLSRMLSVRKLQEYLDKSMTSATHLIWRDKAKDAVTNSKFNTFFHVRERIQNGISYGPPFYIFNPIIWWRYFRFLYTTVRPRLKAARIFSASKHINNTLAYNIFYSFRLAFLTEALIVDAIRYTSPKVFIGSDSGGVAARTEMLVGKRLGCTTVSTPHGFQAYQMASYNYLADILTTHGEGTKEMLIGAGVSEKSVLLIGNNVYKKEAAEHFRKPIKVVIATRSWGGLWSSYSAKQDVYHEQLRLLLSYLNDSKEYEVTIKSHPNGDLWSYYDELVKLYPQITHAKEGWSVDRFIENTDVLLLIGEMPSFYLEAIYAKVPVIFITKTMTKTQKKLGYDQQLAGAVVEDVNQALQTLNKITYDAVYLDELLKKQERAALRYKASDNPEQTLGEYLIKLI